MKGGRGIMPIKKMVAPIKCCIIQGVTNKRKNSLNYEQQEASLYNVRAGRWGVGRTIDSAGRKGWGEEKRKKNYVT
jgi:hypothetical protein